MPSLRVMSALAVAALGPQPVRSFLMPTGVPSAALSRRRGGQLTGTPTATTPFRARVSRSRNQESRRGALMMAKKKGGTKKKGNTAGGGGAAAKKKSAKTAGGAGGVGSGSGSAATVVEAPAMSAAEAAATSVTAVVEAEHNENLGPDTSSSSGTPVIQNRTSDAEPVADVNGSSASAAPTRAPASKASEGASKGFGAPVAEPKAAPKKSQQQQKQQQQQQRQAAGGVSSAGPPVRQGVGGLDALAPGVPVAGNTDHQKVRRAWVLGCCFKSAFERCAGCPQSMTTFAPYRVRLPSVYIQHVACCAFGALRPVLFLLCCCTRQGGSHRLHIWRFSFDCCYVLVGESYDQYGMSGRSSVTSRITIRRYGTCPETNPQIATGKYDGARRSCFLTCSHCAQFCKKEKHSSHETRCSRAARVGATRHRI